MNIIYSDMPLPEIVYDKNWNVIDPLFTFNKSIFLAGPTPRKPEVKSWRPEAIEILKELKYDGYVLVPERQDWSVKFEYEDQVEWEYEALSRTRYIIFWVPRSFPDMPALTTNVEFGCWLIKRPHRVYYGRPDTSEKNRYLDWFYKKQIKCDPANNLRQLIETVYKNINHD